MLMGCFFSIGNGVSLIFYAEPLKGMIKAFDPENNPDQIIDGLSSSVNGFLLNSIFVFLNASLMTIMWTLSSQRQLMRVRNMYYKTLLDQ
jgi:hypothetical protein